ncbi:transcription elongation factor GreA [Candidatus Saccharibacteria bacterium]|nr:transcription elongation factor GreA [Candidatus Saccharibacteria bacterium]
MKKTYQLTSDGRKNLMDELAELKGKRGAIADKIAAARDYGDLSENAEYDTAREEQGIVETRIAEIEDILLNAEEIKASRAKSVHLGNKVTLRNDKKEVTYTIVGAVEANPLEGKISDQSPIGQQLLGKNVGDEVTITTPKGATTYSITALS